MDNFKQWTGQIIYIQLRNAAREADIHWASYPPPGSGVADAAGLWVGGEGGKRIGVDKT